MNKENCALKLVDEIILYSRNLHLMLLDTYVLLQSERILRREQVMARQHKHM